MFGRSKKSAAAINDDELFHAIVGGDLARVRQLVGRVNIAARMQGCTALHFAADKGNAEIAKLLLESGADVNAQGEGTMLTALHYAAGAAARPLLQVLLAAPGIAVDTAEADGQTALHMAVSSGNIDTLADVLGAGASVDATDNSGTTPLMLAAELGKTKAVIALVAAGAQLESKDTRSRSTALHRACRAGKLRSAASLVSKGADVNATTRDGDTPLLLAMQEHKAQLVDMLVDSGADALQSNKAGVHAVALALKMGNAAMLASLTRSGSFAVNAATASGSTLLIDACATGDASMVQVLIDAGADASLSNAQTGMTPLLAAVVSGSPPVLQAVLAQGVESVAEHHAATGRTPLQEACLRGHTALISVLVGAGSDIGAGDVYGMTALHAASLSGDAAGVTELLGIGADVHVQDALGNIPLHYACCDAGPGGALWAVVHGPVGEDVLPLRDTSAPGRQGGGMARSPSRRATQAEAAARLLGAGSVPDVANAQQWTPLMLAAHANHAASGRVLIKHGASLDSALTLALQQEHVDFAEMLVASGRVDLAEVDERGWAPIHAAAHGGLRSVVGALLRAGCSLDMATTDGATPLHLAAKQGERKMVDMLLSKGANAAAEDGSRSMPLHYAAGEAELSAQQQDLSETAAAAAMAERMGNKVKIADQLVSQHKAPLNSVTHPGNFTPLHMAVASGNVRMVKYLLRHQGTNAAALDDNGWSALHHAVAQDAAEMALLLCKHGSVGNSDWLCVAAQNLAASSLAVLLDPAHGVLAATPALLDAPDSEGYAPLHHAVAAGGAGDAAVATIKQLLSHGAAIDVQTGSEGWTALHMAARSGSVAAMTALLGAGAQLDMLDATASSVVHHAVSSGLPEVLRALVALSTVSLDERNVDGVAPLHLAAMLPSRDMVMELVQGGADCGVLDLQGVTAADYAENQGNEDTLAALLDAGAVLTGAPTRSMADAEASASTARVMFDASLVPPDQDDFSPEEEEILEQVADEQADDALAIVAEDLIDQALVHLAEEYQVEAEAEAEAKAREQQLAAERAAAEQAERVQIEAERAGAEQAERDRIAAEQAAVEQAERERLEAEQATAEQAERERLEAEQAAAEQAERDRIAAEQAAAEQAECERIEAEQAAAEQADRERLEAEQAAAEQAERERLEAEQAAAEQAERERLEAEQAAAEQAECERLEAERAAAEQAERERLEAEQAAAEQAERERLEAEQAQASASAKTTRQIKEAGSPRMLMKHHWRPDDEQNKATALKPWQHNMVPGTHMPRPVPPMTPRRPAMQPAAWRTNMKPLDQQQRRDEDAEAARLAAEVIAKRREVMRARPWRGSDDDANGADGSSFPVDTSPGALALAAREAVRAAEAQAAAERERRARIMTQPMFPGKRRPMRRARKTSGSHSSNRAGAATVRGTSMHVLLAAGQSTDAGGSPRRQRRDSARLAPSAAALAQPMGTGGVAAARAAAERRLRIVANVTSLLASERARVRAMQQGNGSRRSGQRRESIQQQHQLHQQRALRPSGSSGALPRVYCDPGMQGAAMLVGLAPPRPPQLHLAASVSSLASIAGASPAHELQSISTASSTTSMLPDAQRQDSRPEPPGHEISPVLRQGAADARRASTLSRVAAAEMAAVVDDDADDGADGIDCDVDLEEERGIGADAAASERDDSAVTDSRTGGDSQGEGAAEAPVRRETGPGRGVHASTASLATATPVLLRKPSASYKQLQQLAETLRQTESETSATVQENKDLACEVQQLRDQLRKETRAHLWQLQSRVVLAKQLKKTQQELERVQTKRQTDVAQRRDINVQMAAYYAELQAHADELVAQMAERTEDAYAARMEMQQMAEQLQASQDQLAHERLLRREMGRMIDGLEDLIGPVLSNTATSLSDLVQGKPHRRPLRRPATAWSDSSTGTRSDMSVSRGRVAAGSTTPDGGRLSMYGVDGGVISAHRRPSSAASTPRPRPRPASAASGLKSEVQRNAALSASTRPRSATVPSAGASSLQHIVLGLGKQPRRASEAVVPARSKDCDGSTAIWPSQGVRLHVPLPRIQVTTPDEETRSAQLYRHVCGDACPHCSQQVTPRAPVATPRVLHSLLDASAWGDEPEPHIVLQMRSRPPSARPASAMSHRSSAERRSTSPYAVPMPRRPPSAVSAVSSRSTAIGSGEAKHHRPLGMPRPMSALKLERLRRAAYLKGSPRRP